MNNCETCNICMRTTTGIKLSWFPVQLGLVTHVIQRYPVGVVQPQGGPATVLRDESWWPVVHFLNPINYIPQTFPGTLKKYTNYT